MKTYRDPGSGVPSDDEQRQPTTFAKGPSKFKNGWPSSAIRIIECLKDFSEWIVLFADGILILNQGPH